MDQISYTSRPLCASAGEKDRGCLCREDFMDVIPSRLIQVLITYFIKYVHRMGTNYEWPYFAPVFAYSLEQSFSHFCLLKTHQRQTMQVEQLNGFDLLAIHKDTKLNYVRCRDFWVPRKYDTRLKLQ